MLLASGSKETSFQKPFMESEKHIARGEALVALMLRNAFVFLTFTKAAGLSSLALQPAKKQGHREHSPSDCTKERKAGAGVLNSCKFSHFRYSPSRGRISLPTQWILAGLIFKTTVQLAGAPSVPGPQYPTKGSTGPWSPAATVCGQG